VASVIKRIIIFLFTLLIIVLLLAGAAKGDQLLSSKEFIKKELPLDQGNDKLIITEAQEYPKRTFYFDPLVVFDEQDEVSLCGYELTTVDFTGTRIVVSLYAALFDSAPAIINYVRLETLQLTPFDKELSFSDMKKLELYPYTMEIIKNNTLFESLERNNSKASAIIHESSNNYLLNKGKILKEFYMGGYDLHVEFIKGYPIHIPIPQNIKFLNAKIDLIDHCLIELRKNEKKTKIPEENYLKEASYRIQ